MTLYEKLVAEGIETGNNCSDLYFPVTDRTKEILREYPQSKAIVFLNQITKTYWYSVNFAYDPFWKPDGYKLALNHGNEQSGTSTTANVDP